MIIIIIYQSSFIKLVLTVQFCVFCLGMLWDNRSTNHQQSRNQQSNLLHEDRCFTRVDQTCLNWECSRVYHLDWWVTSSQKVRVSVRKIRRVRAADRICDEGRQVRWAVVFTAVHSAFSIAYTNRIRPIPHHGDKKADKNDQLTKNQLRSQGLSSDRETLGTRLTEVEVNGFH